MENQNGKSSYMIAGQYAAILAVITTIVTLGSYLGGLSYVWGGIIEKLLKWLVFIIVFSFCMGNWKKKHDNITYGQAFLFGLKVIVFYVGMMLIVDFCFFQFVAPDYFEQLRTHTLQMMIDYGVPQAKIDQTEAQFAEGAKNATPLGLMLNMAITRAIADLITLLIVAIFIRKSTPFTPGNFESSIPNNLA